MRGAEWLTKPVQLTPSDYGPMRGCASEMTSSAVLTLPQSAPEADWIDYTSENDRHGARPKRIGGGDLGHRAFQEAWQAYRLALDAFNEITNKL